MKKFIIGSILLFTFVISISIFQSSCTKAEAQSQTVNQLGKIVYFTSYQTPDVKLWIANYDGTNRVQVPIVLPANVVFDPNVATQTLRISPDGQRIFFSVHDRSTPTTRQFIYSCDQFGNNLGPVNLSTTESVYLGQAY